MAERYYVAVYTDSGFTIACDHKHRNITTATACISQPGGYVVAVRGGRFASLAESEEAEFQAAIHGHTQGARAAVPEFKMGVNQPAKA